METKRQKIIIYRRPAIIIFRRMASIDLLEELKLTDYYPQKLSFSEAIKLSEKSQDSNQEQYGIEIVRRLLMFDSAAVVSVTTEMNKRLNKAETDNKGQCVSDGGRPQQDIGRPSRRRDKTVPSGRKLHPMDLLVVVLNCCDDFLRQVLVEKMFVNKLSIPILLPDIRNGTHTLLLLALRSLIPEVQDRAQEGPTFLTDTLVDVKNPVVSFIRVGKLHRSKSKLINDLLNSNSFNTFFHRGSSHGSAKRSVSDGSIEAAWFQSSTATEEEFNRRFFTALNLRGDAKDYPKQTTFLCQSSTLVVFMVDSFESCKELYESTLKDVDASITKVIVCCSSTTFPENDDEQISKFMDDLIDRGVVYAEIDDCCEDGEKISDVEFTNRIRDAISKFFKAERLHQMPMYVKNSERGKILGFSLDEDKAEYKLGKNCADEFVRFILKFPLDCKPVILPLQDEPWRKIGKLQREQQGKSENKNQDENFIAEKEIEKRRQRDVQCRSLIEQNAIAQPFSLKFHLLLEQNLLYFINACEIKLDARRQVVISNILEEYTRKNQENSLQRSEEKESEAKVGKIELKIANSAIGLEHFLRECGQMYEAVISEEMRMREELSEAPLTPDIIRNFPSIVARLLLMGHMLELMDGEASNVPVTWLKAVLHQVNILTNNARVFVLSIIGVQSSGKSTLLNAMFGLRFPVSAGRCTKGIYCHLVPVDKESLNVEYDYVLVVDTEGLGSSEFMENSTFRDNELATFAIGLADATIINMKGENWAEMKDILQIAAYGLIRVRKTKADLELMPRCMFVHQNVPAADAKTKNQLGQAKQLLLLDHAIEAAGREEGFTEITKFDQVIKYDPNLHSWFFPDLWNGRPPTARISQDYIAKTNELRQHLMQVMKANPSKLKISGFFLRLSDLWNAMLHNDFVLCFRNTQEIISGTILNDRISHQVDKLNFLYKLEQKKIRELICSFTNVEEFRAENENILMKWRSAADENFTKIKATLQEIIDATNISATSKQKYELSLQALGDGEFRRIDDEMANDVIVHMKKLEIGTDPKVKDLKARLAHLEKQIEEVDKDKLTETGLKRFEESWQHLIADNQMLADERMRIEESDTKQTIRGSIEKLFPQYTVQFESVNWAYMFKTPLVDEMPQVTQNDIVQNEDETGLRLEVDHACIESYVYKANSRLKKAHEMWELQFNNRRCIGFNALHLNQIMFNAGRLLGILAEEHYEAGPATDENMCSALPPRYSFISDYTSRFMEFVWHFAFNRSLEKCKNFILLTDPLADVSKLYIRSVSNYRQMSAEANSDAVGKQIFEFSKRSFVRDLGELIKTEVCKENSTNPTFRSKRAFLKAILIDLGQKTHTFTHMDEGKEILLKKFMLYAEMADSEASENFFFDLILMFLKETLTKKNASESAFQEMVRNNVGEVVSKAKRALRQADTKSSGHAREYIRIFKEQMKTGNEIDFRISVFDGFTKAVFEKIDKLYADFFNNANSLFETLVCEDNKAALRIVFEKIMGCREKCPFCSAPCAQSLQQHADNHRANHYPMGVSGTVDSSGWLTSIQETNEVRRKPRKLIIDTCQTMVGSHKNIRTPVTVQKYCKWYHYWFNWNYQSFKDYKEVTECANWDIPYSGDPKTSLYWKWFMAQLDKELAEYHKALRPEIPKAWKIITWEEAKESLDDIDLNN